ncbi:peptidase inhibitor family I36 protein [Streptomyces sp. F63]|uniref:peptidase inhibitor family I36 protein n=1 Tax=Streptomyces sp. F63 TaxID=2824887 RepID=UPI001B39470D|nr:peptidase inhibitor family I36 protein [Streptomyces sp. F63]MBQ0988224.1 peptidase inhibitor family I36 protein [Streptomyces sp. F63]
MGRGPRLRPGAPGGDPRRAVRRDRAERHCPSGYVCFWSRPCFQGITRVHKNPRFHICGWVPGHQTRSVVNRDNQAWSFYEDVNCRAHAVTLAPGRSAANVLVLVRTRK